MNRMFFKCYHLISVSEYSNRNNHHDNSHSNGNTSENNSYSNFSSENQSITFEYKENID